MTDTDEAMTIRNGDQMQWPEFVARCGDDPRTEHYELMGGVVHTHASVRFGQHGFASADLIGALGDYSWRTRGVGWLSPHDVSMTPTPPIADAILIRAECGGRTRTDAAGFLYGPPELVAEVSATEADIESNGKKRLYESFDVPEYVVWRVRDRAVDWFELRDGRYSPLPTVDGILRSRRLPGLQLDIAALLDGEAQRVVDRIDQGLALPEHAAFVQRLQAARGATP